MLEKMFKFKRIFFLLLILIPIEIVAQDNFFLYIPSEEEIQDFLGMRIYLKKWNDNEIKVDNKSIDILFNRYLGKDTLHSLMFEAFLRYTKNKSIQDRVLKYIKDKKIDNNFTKNLIKLYASRKITSKNTDGEDVIQYNYKSQEYDENINLFWSDEVNVFNNELGFLLFYNNWHIFNINDTNDLNRNIVSLIYGGGTNSITIILQKYANIEEKNIESKFQTELFKKKYENNWENIEMPLEGILRRSGADRIITLHGTGPEIIETIDSGTFIVYLYNRSTKVLYEVSYYMNFSPINIHYSERKRIYNLLLFQLFLVFLE